jgi:hypothetical protein
MRPVGNAHRRALLALIGCSAILIAGLAGLAGPVLGKKKHRLAQLGPYPSLGSCQVFPPSTAPAGAPGVEDETAWNQDISAAPVDPGSAAYIAFINAHGASTLHPDFGSLRIYGIPYAVTAKAKRTRVKFTAFGGEATHGVYHVPLNAPVEGGPKASGDRHVLSIFTPACQLNELFNAFPRMKGKKRWDADVGVIWDLNSPALRTEGFTSADAAGLPIFPGLVRYDEAASGAINHAIRMTVDTSQKAYVHPATHCAGASSDPAAPPMGLRLRLKADYNVAAITGPAHAIAVAMQHYGLIVADNGSNWYLSGTSDRRWDDNNLNQIKDIPGSAFEAVKSAAPIHAC